VKYTNIN